MRLFADRLFNTSSWDAVAFPDIDWAVIYSITCLPTGQSYIGGTLRVKKRIRQHSSLLHRGKHSNKPLQTAFDKYGVGEFVVKVLETCRPRDRLKREAHWLKELKATKGVFNVKSIRKIHPDDFTMVMMDVLDSLIETPSAVR